MMAPKASPPSVSKTIKGSVGGAGSSSSTPPESKKSRSTTTKLISKNVSSSEKRIVRVSDLQTNLKQFQENLKKAKSEKCQLVKQVQELKQTLTDNNTRLSLLSLEEQRAKVSEHNMLESMVLQTKQLEQAKIDLEESKLEISSLRQTIHSLEHSPSKNIKNIIARKHTENKNMMVPVSESDSESLKCAEKEIAKLRCQLNFANEAEENGKMALDDLGVALREVTIEANEAKQRLSEVELELASLSTQTDSTKSILRTTQAKLQCTLDDTNRINDDFSRVRKENCVLVESNGMLMEEISKLKETVNNLKNEGKQLENSLEIVTIENSQLKDNVSKLETSLLSTSSSSSSEKSKLIITGETTNPCIATDNTESDSGPVLLKDSSFTMVDCSSTNHDKDDTDDRLSWNCDEFDHIDENHIREMQNEESNVSPSTSSAAAVKKSTKNPPMFFQKLGGMMKGKRFHK